MTQQTLDQMGNDLPPPLDQSFKDMWNEAGEKKAFEPLMPGVYPAQITRCMLVLEQPADWPPQKPFERHVDWEFTVDLDNRTQKVWSRTELTREKLWKLRINMDAMRQEIASEADIPVALENCLNQHVRIEIRNSQYNGKTYNHPTIVEPIDNTQDDVPDFA